jgi:hypothetical protein
MTTLSNDDFTLYQEAGKLMSGGFSIKTSESTSSMQIGGGHNDLLDNLAMPLYYFTQRGGKKNNHKYEKSTPEDVSIIDNDLFDKLLNLVEYKKENNLKREKVIKKRGTKKHIDNLNPNSKSGKKTRKNKLTT